MPTYRDDMHTGHKVPLVETDDISNGAITEEKLADQAVDARTLKDSEVVWQKLSPDLQNIIASREEGGVALSNEFGDSELIGITQKKLSEAHDDLQNQINAIVNDKAAISLKASPSVIFVNTQTSITLTATTDTTASLIRIVTGADAAIIAEGSGSSLAKAVNLTMPSAGTAGYTAQFTISGIIKSTHVNISAVNKIYYGSGSAYTDATSSPSPKTSPAGTYTVVVPYNADYVFFVVPRTMNINNAKMSGFDFPLQPPVNVEIDGVEYKYYQSSNTYDAGTLTIEIS